MESLAGTTVHVVFAVDPWDERTVLKLFAEEEAALGYVASLQESTEDHYIYIKEERKVE